MWEPVNEDKICLTLPERADHAPQESVRLMAPANLPPVLANQELLSQSLTPYVQSVSPYQFALSSEPASSWPGREAASAQGAEYTTLGQLGPRGEAAATTVAAKRSPQDFYTCVQMMKESGEVHLVPCLPPASGQDPPPWSRQKKEKMAELMVASESSGSADPLVSVAVGNQG